MKKEVLIYYFNFRLKGTPVNDYTARKESVLVIALLEENNMFHVALTRPLEQSNQKRRPQIRIPGGGVEKNETILQAGKRELEEEVGLDVKDLRLIDSIHKKSRNKKFAIHTQHILIGEVLSLRGFKDHARDGNELLVNQIVSIDQVQKTLMRQQFLEGYDILKSHADVLTKIFSKIFGDLKV